MNPDTATILIEAAARGETAAFAELYTAYRRQVYGFAYQMLGTQTLAEEVTQEAFMVLVEHPERYQAERGSVLTFLCAVARNHVLQQLRRHAQRYEIGGEAVTDCLEQVSAQHPDPLAMLLNRELSDAVERAIAVLPPLLREVIVLREYHELSYDEIAHIVGAHTSVVKVRLHRARRKLADRLAPYLTRQTATEAHEKQR